MQGRGEELVLRDYRDAVSDVFSGGLFRGWLDFVVLREGGEQGVE